MMLRRILFAFAVALPLAPIAFGDDLADANTQCVATNTAALTAANPGLTPEEKMLYDTMIGSICGCVTAKFAALGDDGAKMLRVLARMTPEQGAAGAADPAVDKANVSAILVAEFAMSQADAEAFYDRFDPQVKEIANSCVAEAEKATATPAPTP